MGNENFWEKTMTLCCFFLFQYLQLSSWENISMKEKINESRWSNVRREFRTRLESSDGDSSRERNGRWKKVREQIPRSVIDLYALYFESTHRRWSTSERPDEKYVYKSSVSSREHGIRENDAGWRDRGDIVFSSYLEAYTKRKCVIMHEISSSRNFNSNQQLLFYFKFISSTLNTLYFLNVLKNNWKKKNL